MTEEERRGKEARVGVAALPDLTEEDKLTAETEIGTTEVKRKCSKTERWRMRRRRERGLRERQERRKKDTRYMVYDEYRYAFNYCLPV